MYKKVYANDSDLKFNYLEEPLNFNKMPKPCEEITEKEYFDQINTWHFDYIGSFQLHDTEAFAIMNTMWPVNVFCDFNNDCGYARAVNPYTGEMKFFRIGCNHDYKLIDEDYVSNTYKCEKCGNIITMPNGR